MKPLDEALRLQAWVDGELDATEAGEVQAWVEADERARAIAESLRSTKAVLSAHEVRRPVPETREFYWSRIARRIESEERARVPAVGEAGGLVAWWRRWLLPVGALAALLLVVPMARWLPGSAPETALSLGHEIDTPVANVDAFTFRSESERMTVVWVSFDTN